MTRGKRDSQGRLRDARGRLMKDPSKKAKGKKAKGKKGKKGLALHAKAHKGAKRTLAARVSRLESQQEQVVKAVVQLHGRMQNVEHAVQSLASGLARRFGSGAAKQLGSG